MHNHWTLSLLFLTTALSGTTQVQSEDFTTSDIYSSPGSHPVIPADFLSATFQPFNPNLGTLESFTIAWTLNITWDYTVFEGGNHGVSGGVDAFLNDINYTGTGGGSGHSFPGSGTLSINPNRSVTYTVADISGETQIALLSIVTGTEPFLARYVSSINADLIGDVIVDLTAISEATLTYTYSAIPEPGSIALLLGVGALAVPILRRRAIRKRASA